MNVNSISPSFGSKFIINKDSVQTSEQKEDLKDLINCVNISNAELPKSDRTKIINSDEAVIFNNPNSHDKSFKNFIGTEFESIAPNFDVMA
ncbi:MAG: hypothetical protein PHV68_04585 [Candidatus Gastranaerophilales bacterium]|nr:hypothetical protein [Candidatus Gastranaerophilales bacterium]